MHLFGDEWLQKLVSTFQHHEFCICSILPVFTNKDIVLVTSNTKASAIALLYLSTPIVGITGSVLLIIFRSLISLCFITCLIRISFNLKNDQKNRPHDPEVERDIPFIFALDFVFLHKRNRPFCVREEGGAVRAVASGAALLQWYYPLPLSRLKQING